MNLTRAVGVGHVSLIPRPLPPCIRKGPDIYMHTWKTTALYPHFIIQYTINLRLPFSYFCSYYVSTKSLFQQLVDRGQNYKKFTIV